MTNEMKQSFLLMEACFFFFLDHDDLLSLI
ncbi:hypothetical protein ABID47_001685 [Paenibacillus favisporus]|uniref:Uncharacterized protein n=1 Tax=Paenibacillus favisporus TaxID=221028 RepID=A0ABV2EZX5_9BACL